MKLHSGLLLLLPLLLSACAPEISMGPAPAAPMAPAPSLESGAPTPNGAEATKSIADTTDEEMIERFTPTWAALVAWKSDVSPEVVLHETSIVERKIERYSDGGVAMTVTYDVVLEWLTERFTDKFMLGCTSCSKWRKHPTSDWLTLEEQKEIHLSHTPIRLWFPLSRVPFGRMKFHTRTDALKALVGKSGVVLDERDVRIMSVDWNGASELSMAAPGKNAWTGCFAMYLNLVTGEGRREYLSCRHQILW